jgi:hypothetical protein
MSKPEDGSSPYPVSRLEWLTLLANIYAREGFGFGNSDVSVSLSFRAQPPNTVAVCVTYLPSVPFETAKDAAALGADFVQTAAKEMGWDTWARVTCDFINAKQ